MRASQRAESLIGTLLIAAFNEGVDFGKEGRISRKLDDATGAANDALMQYVARLERAEAAA
jgi:hypothetical protein